MTEKLYVIRWIFGKWTYDGEKWRNSGEGRLYRWQDLPDEINGPGAADMRELYGAVLTWAESVPWRGKPGYRCCRGTIVAVVDFVGWIEQEEEKCEKSA